MLEILKSVCGIKKLNFAVLWCCNF